MSLLGPRRRFDPAVLEMMDRPNPDEVLLQDDLKNLRNINKFFGGLAATRNAITPLLLQMNAEREATILDLATGSADQPLAIVRLARTLGRRVHIVAVDRHPVMLQVAREMTAGIPEISIEAGDLLALPYPDKSFDIVLCSLALHHFSRDDAIRILRNMSRLSRVGFIVNDLNRSWPGAWTAWLYTHLTTRNPITRYDSYLSVLRGFTRDELVEMAREAGFARFQVYKRPFFRLMLVGTFSC